MGGAISTSELAARSGAAAAALFQRASPGVLRAAEFLVHVTERWTSMRGKWWMRNLGCQRQQSV